MCKYSHIYTQRNVKTKCLKEADAWRDGPGEEGSLFLQRTWVPCPAPTSGRSPLPVTLKAEDLTPSGLHSTGMQVVHEIILTRMHTH